MTLAGALLRLALAAGNSGLTMDSPLYVHMSEGYPRPVGELGPAHHGYSLFVAAARGLGAGRELAGRLVSFAAGVGLIPIVWALARRLAPAPAALGAAALVAFHPLAASFSGAVMTEATFQLLAYGALLLLMGGRVAAGGATLGVAYWVRPEALVFAAAATPAVAGARARAVWLAAFALAALPEVAALSVERGALTFTPKTNLIAAAGAARDDAEWRATAADSAAPRPLPETLAGVAARYPDRLLGQLARLHQAWPAPLLALAAVGALARAGPLRAPLALLPVLPLLGVTPHLRHPQGMLPALAVLAAAGAGALLARAGRVSPRRRTLAAGALAAAALAGLVLCWIGPAGEAARRFDDGPMRSLRRAGEWLAVNGRAGALVMDRKPYVPFFARMRYEPMPDDAYDALIEHARRRGVDYLVVEEYVMLGMRRQFIPLMTDSAFRAGERRLRMVYGADEGPLTGVAIFAVLPAP